MLQFTFVSSADVILIHDRIIGKMELQGLTKDKSLDAVLDRVHNRLQFGFITDIFDLAACYATFVAKGHCFNDANKRTAAALLFLVLCINGIEISFKDLSLGEWIIDVATDRKTEIELAEWLRSQIS